MSYWHSYDNIVPPKSENRNSHYIPCLTHASVTCSLDSLLQEIYQNVYRLDPWLYWELVTTSKNSSNDARMRQWEEHKNKLTGLNSQIALLFSFSFWVNVTIMISIVYCIKSGVYVRKVAIKQVAGRITRS